MAQGKRIAITVPNDLLADVERLLALDCRTRNALICEAVQSYVAERKRREMRQQLRFGYTAMGQINLTLAEEGPVFERMVGRGAWAVERT